MKTLHQFYFHDFPQFLRFPVNISGQDFRSGIFDQAVCSSSKTKQFPLGNKDKWFEKSLCDNNIIESIDDFLYLFSSQSKVFHLMIQSHLKSWFSVQSYSSYVSYQMSIMNLTLKILNAVRMFNFSIIVEHKVIQELGNG